VTLHNIGSHYGNTARVQLRVYDDLSVAIITYDRDDQFEARAVDPDALIDAVSALAMLRLNAELDKYRQRI
jgi:hypothetical protein